MRKLKVIAALVLATASLVFASSVMAAVRNTDVTTARKGNVLVAVNGTFSSATKDEILNRVNAIRQEACLNGYVNPSNGTKLKKSDYVPVKWSADLEWIAQTRAAEASVHQVHNRPNGTTAFDLKHGGIGALSECLAFNNTGMMDAVESWYSEKAAWVASADKSKAGHYASLINPEYNYIALGTFTMPDDFDVTAGEFTSTSQPQNESKTGVLGVYDQVVEVYKPNTRIALSPITVYVKYNAQMRLNGTIVGTDIFGGGKETKGYVASGIKWYSNNAAAVSVNQATGVLTGVKAGSAVISAAFDGGNYSALASCKKFTVGKGKKPSLKNLKGKKIKITYKAVTSANGYRIQVAMNKKFKKAKKYNLTGKTKTVKVRKLNKKYFVRVRAYRVDPNGKKKWGKWSAKKTIVVKK